MVTFSDAVLSFTYHFQIHKEVLKLYQGDAWTLGLSSCDNTNFRQKHPGAA